MAAVTIFVAIGAVSAAAGLIAVVAIVAFATVIALLSVIAALTVVVQIPTIVVSAIIATVVIIALAALLALPAPATPIAFVALRVPRHHHASTKIQTACFTSSASKTRLNNQQQNTERQLQC